MEYRRISPENNVKSTQKTIRYIPVFISLLLLINGAFNFTTVNEAFIVVAIISGIVAVYMIFFKPYRRYSSINDAIAFAVFGWCIVICISSAWAVDASAAFNSLVAYSAAFFMFCIARTYTRERSENATALIRAIGYAGGAISLVSIEMASTGFIVSLYRNYLNGLFHITEDTASFGGWVEGVRMQSVMGLPNIYATFAGMCFFITLSLVAGPRKVKVKILDICSLVMNGAGFFLADSRGGMIAFFISGLICVLFSLKRERLRMFLNCILFTGWSGATAIIMSRWMGQGTPYVMLILFGMIFLLWLCWPLFNRVLESISGVKDRVLMLVITGIAAICAVYGGFAFNLKTDFSLRPGTVLTRAARLQSGGHALNITTDLHNETQALHVSIRSCSMEQAALQAHDNILEVDLPAGQNAYSLPFSVPQGSAAVFVTIEAEGGYANIIGLDINGYELPLRYRMIPEALVSRLQGIWADPNILQRFVFWRDGWKLYKQSPIIGQGCGAFGILVPSVSESYYTTKHVHNHYLQMLIENGWLGLMFLLVVCVVVPVLLWRKRANSVNGLVPCIYAGICMMLIHSLFEASMYNVLNIAVFFLFLGIASGICAREKRSSILEYTRGAVCVYAVIAVVLLDGRFVTQKYVRNAEVKGTEYALSAYRWATLTDPLNASSYKYACIARYLANPESGAKQLAAGFAEDLAKHWKTPRDMYIVARYYLRVNDVEKAVEYFERYVELERVNPIVWDEVLAQYFRYLRAQDTLVETSEILTIKTSTIRLGRYLNEVNDRLPVEIKPYLISIDMILGSLK